MEKIWVNEYDKDVPKDLAPITDKTLIDIFKRTVGRYPANTALNFFGKKIKYRELNELSDKLARFLQAKIKPGDRVALMLPNSPQFVISYLAVLKIGAVVVAINVLQSETEIEYQLKDSDARAIIALDLFWNKIREMKDQTSLKLFIVTGIKDFLPFPKNLLYPIKAKKEGTWVKVEEKYVWSFSELMKYRMLERPLARVEVKPDDLAVLQYTGGTTGLAKGVMLSHSNLVNNTYQCRIWMPFLKEGEEKNIAVLPFFHVYGLTASINISILLAGEIILLPKFDVVTVLKTISKEKPTMFPGIQKIYAALLAHPDIDKYDLKGIKVCISGAGPLYRETQKKFEELTGAKIVEGYGLSESSPVTHINPTNPKDRVYGSIGLPIPGTETKIVDMETGKDLPVGGVGELAIRGPQVMKGYWKNPAETDNVLKDGWLYTGDVVRMDERGYFYIMDRKKDMIKIGGENVYPREVEEVLYTHPKVQEVVVAGIPHPSWGEIIKAYIIVKEGKTCTAQEIIEFCKEKMGKYKVPKEVEFRKELPKNIIGKILRRKLREEEMEKQKK